MSSTKCANSYSEAEIAVGFNTTVLILNDGITNIKADADEFVNGIIECLMRGGDVRVGTFTNVARVLPSAHADIHRVYSSHGNHIMEMEASPELVARYLKEKSYRELIDRRIKWVNAQVRRMRRELNAALAKSSI